MKSKVKSPFGTDLAPRKFTHRACSTDLLIGRQIWRATGVVEVTGSFCAFGSGIRVYQMMGERPILLTELTDSWEQWYLCGVLKQDPSEPFDNTRYRLEFATPGRVSPTIGSPSGDVETLEEGLSQVYCNENMAFYEVGHVVDGVATNRFRTCPGFKAYPGDLVAHGRLGPGSASSAGYNLLSTVNNTGDVYGLLRLRLASWLRNDIEIAYVQPVHLVLKAGAAYTYTSEDLTPHAVDDSLVLAFGFRFVCTEVGLYLPEPHADSATDDQVGQDKLSCAVRLYEAPVFNRARSSPSASSAPSTSVSSAAETGVV